MKNIHVLPTEKPSRLYYHLELKQLVLTNKSILRDVVSNQNIYITSDEEIKDSGIGTKVCIFKSDSGRITCLAGKGYGRVRTIGKYYEVILTTDQDLINDGVQAIDDEFLEWFVKNPSCEYVEVKKFFGFAEDYLIIIPKEEPKEFDIRELNRLDDIEIEEMSNDWATMSQQIKPKQETLEEVAERILANNIDGLRDALQDDDLFFFYKGVIQCYGEAMVEWQQEQDKKMYSEEDMFKFLDFINNRYYGSFSIDKEDLQEWFEQFKKK
jgi:hypothetical protein